MNLLPSRTRPALAALLAAGLLALSACSGSDGSGEADQTATQPADSPTSASTADAGEGAQAGHSGHYAEPAKSRRLRAGETRTTIAMPGAYTPSAPYGTGTDDYRCFLLDPDLDEDAWLTGTQVLPGNPDVVHHVILFQVPPGQVAAAEAKDAAEDGEGWTCFGGTGLTASRTRRASWIGAWAPGGEESVTEPGYGLRLRKGSRS